MLNCNCYIEILLPCAKKNGQASLRILSTTCVYKSNIYLI